IAAVLLGDVNPAGRLPMTFYHAVGDLPSFADYGMAGRTYRYFTGDVLYPFGFGLSYTRFHYDRLRLPSAVHTGQTLTVSADVTNTGARAGDEVVELYLTDRGAPVPVPIRILAGFARVSLRPGERRTVRFVIRPRQRSVVSDSGVWQEHAGAFDLSIGGEQPGQHGGALAATTDVVTGSFVVQP
ncbi:MAG TPA: fibronectin type III-like domain-contianing protein, partial [Gemmatimonadales bacterium]|nr:fibronectin type III-like domain-contianing protein [Gemmatimonadales bacterium]